MADHSFDIVSEVDLNEMHNAIMQAQREIVQRFDFRGTSAGVGELDKKEKLVKKDKMAELIRLYKQQDDHSTVH